MFRWFKRRKAISKPTPELSGVTPPPARQGYWGGDKYPGGFGPTWLYTMDYWSLRQKSAQLFRDNLYARGLLRRLVTTIINTGLTLEAVPDEALLGLSDGSLDDWSENVENLFSLWAKDPNLCDVKGRRTFGQIQREQRLEALICGDVLVSIDIDKNTSMPKIRLMSGNLVRSPLDDRGRGAKNKIIHGVEVDSDGRHVAFWVVQEDNTTKRVPAYGLKSGRRVAWLVYGCDKRMDDVRGEPILSLVAQNLKEIDRMRDSVQRKANLNAIIAAFIQREEDGIGTLPLQQAATSKRGYTQATDDSDAPRSFAMTEHIPGIVFEHLKKGEKPVPYSNAGTDIQFGPFEEAIIQAVAWANEVPPEILRLASSSNYSASAAAENNLKVYSNMERTKQGEEFDHPIYFEWFVSMVLLGKVKAAGFLESLNDPAKYDVRNAWTVSDWSGAIKLSVDIVKQTKGYETMTKNGWITHARAARELTGTKFSKNVKQLIAENEMLRSINPVSIEENEKSVVNNDAELKAVANG